MNKVTKSYNSTLTRLSSEGSNRGVLQTYGRMVQSSTPPDSHTFPSVLKACTALQLFSLGTLVHRAAILTGSAPDPYVSSALITFYSSFNDLINARTLFDKMPVKNVVPWTAIILGYIKAGDIDTGFRLFNEMRMNRIGPSEVTLLALMAGVDPNSVRLLKSLHCCVVVCGFERELGVGNCLVSKYGKCGSGSLRDARRFFEGMVKRDAVSWNSVIKCYAEVGAVREVVQLLRRMVGPDQQTFGSLVMAVTVNEDVEMGKVVHGVVLKKGFVLDVKLRTSLCFMYMKCGDVKRADVVFEGTGCKDVVLWTAMISGLVKMGCADKAVERFREMMGSGVVPSSETVASVLAACANLGCLDMGGSIHGYVLRNGILLDVAAQNSLITMYAKCGCLKQSTVVFDEMDVKDVVSWNAIVSGYAQNGRLYDALVLFSKMRMTLQRPDSITIVSLLQACASLGALQQGRWIHNFVIRNCLRPCIMIETALIDMYCKCGELETAQKCFDEISQQDLVSWSSMISGYGTHGKGMAALRLFSEFLCTGMKPNHVIFLSVLSACSHNGLVEEGMSLFRSMTEDFGIVPTIEHRACIVDLLCRAGRVKEAYNFYKMMFTEPMVDVLGIILDACRVKGYKELGDMVAKDLLVTKPVHAEHYVQLAHIYASMNKWDDVGEAWIQMRSLGLKKVPGWSFIELHGTITTFFKDHSSHPRFEEIMTVLKSLRKEITSPDLETSNINIDILTNS